MSSNFTPRSGPQWPPEATAAAEAATDHAAADHAAWPPIPGVEGRLPLRTLRGDTGRYVRLLQVFARHHASDVEALRAVCAPGGDLPAVRRCLHGLKGSTATVGATALHALALAVDTRLHHGEPPAALAAELLHLADELQRLIDAIGTLRTG